MPYISWVNSLYERLWISSYKKLLVPGIYKIIGKQLLYIIKQHCLYHKIGAIFSGNSEFEIPWFKKRNFVKKMAQTKFIVKCWYLWTGRTIDHLVVIIKYYQDKNYNHFKWLRLIKNFHINYLSSEIEITFGFIVTTLLLVRFLWNTIQQIYKIYSQPEADLSKITLQTILTRIQDGRRCLCIYKYIYLPGRRGTADGETQCWFWGVW